MVVTTLLGAALLTALSVRVVAESAPAPSVRTRAAEAGFEGEATGLVSPVHRDRTGLGARGATDGSECEDGEQESGAKYRICMPASPVPWNHELVVYAHGYVAPDRPVEIPEDQMTLPGTETSVDSIVTGLGYGFATTSYATNGLAVVPALSDLVDLVGIFSTTKEAPETVYLVGVSEGGLITTLAVEQRPDVFDGGLALCGPYGDFQGQINHFGDFRVVFDYFFPGLMPGSAISIPHDFLQSWRSGYFTSTIEPVVTDQSNMTRVNQLLRVTDVSPYAFAPPTSTNSIQELLGYNVFATNDGVSKLGGQPYGNTERRYTGSNNDELLNDPDGGVERIRADQAALDEIEGHYQTSGELSVPLVTFHTTGDPVVPYWHASRYRGKTIVADNVALHQHFGIRRHGHCSFSPIEMVSAFQVLVQMVEDPPAYEPVRQIFLPAVARRP